MNGDVEGALVPTGRVRAVEPSGFTKLSALGIEEQRVNVVVDLHSVPAGLADGHRLNVAIIVWSSPSALGVPRSALIPGDAAGTWTAFVIRDGAVERRAIRIGHLAGADAEVLGGLEPGDQVVVFPSDRIREGARVAPRAGVTASAP